MANIDKLKIKGFKAFSKEFELNLGGKHLLLYGENGSGKSSIYYALHCLFQSPLKKDFGKKYFDKTHPENLTNNNVVDDENYILLRFQEPHNWEYKISKNGYTPINNGVPILPNNLFNNVFINHKFISNFFSCRNSENIDLFTVFYKDIFPYILVRNGKQILSDVYDVVMSNPSARKEYITDIENLNKETKYWIDNMNLNISNIYNNSFRSKDDNKLEIRLIFKEDPEIINGETTYYWGRYDHRTYKRIVANKPVIRKINLKSFIEPHIGLQIEEILSDGTSVPILKPQAYFNEAKLTAIALSIRFSILDTISGANSRFMALDDMLISLDMSNRAKVVEFLLDISDRYMIYLFTHDKALFEFFKHKSKRHKSAKEWTYKEIYMKENNIPYLRNSKSYLGEAEHFINQRKFEVAGNFLRKETEAFCKRFLPPKWQLTKDYTNLDLNGMIQNCKKYAYESGIADLALFDELDDYRKFILNSSSHDSYDVVKFESEVRRCLETLKTLSKTISEPVLKFDDNVTFTLKTPQPNVKEYKFDIQICDELRVIEIPGQPKVLSKIMINYYVHEDGVKGNKQSSNQTLKKFYDDNYKRSDKTENPDYLEGIKLVFNGLPISSLL